MWSSDYIATDADTRFMAMALTLARRSLGRVAPFPAVGCVIVKDGHIMGRGWTQPGGRPTAEQEALFRAGDKTLGATAYITMEPNASFDEQSNASAIQQLIEGGIKRVVLAMEYPDSRYQGQAIEQFRKAGIDVTVDIFKDKAFELNEGFIIHRQQNRPLVAMKVASTIDGAIATSTKESQWITGQAARQRGHFWRSIYDAVMIGSGTAIQDNALLTCRIPGLEDYSPIRIVMDGRLRLPADSQLAQTAKDTPLWVFTLESADEFRRESLELAGAKVFTVEAGKNGSPSLNAVMKILAGKGVTRLLVEGGAHLNASFMAEDLVDRLIWFRGPAVIGGDGLPSMMGFGVQRLVDAPQFEAVYREQIGSDVMDVFYRMKRH